MQQSFLSHQRCCRQLRCSSLPNMPHMSRITYKAVTSLEKDFQPLLSYVIALYMSCVEVKNFPTNLSIIEYSKLPRWEIGDKFPAEQSADLMCWPELRRMPQHPRCAARSCCPASPEAGATGKLLQGFDLRGSCAGPAGCRQVLPSQPHAELAPERHWLAFLLTDTMCAEKITLFNPSKQAEQTLFLSIVSCEGDGSIRRQLSDTALHRV